MDEQNEVARAQTLRQLAHDLKNPLTAVQVLADMLREDVRPELASDVDDLAEALDLAVLMAEGLSNLARLESGGEPEPQFEEVSLGALAQRMALRAAFRKVVSVEGEGGWVRADPQSFGRVLASVLVNGRRMVGAGRRLRVWLGSDRVVVHHPGVILEDADRLALQQLYGGPVLKKRRVRASALGLGYAERVMEMTGGALQVGQEGEVLLVTLRFRPPRDPSG